MIAYLKACVLYVANGEKWDKTIEEFVRWSFQYDMWCKMEFFGEAIEEAMKVTNSSDSRHGRHNLLEFLPDEFTLQDAIRLRQSVGMNAEGVKPMINQWICRGYITRNKMTNDKMTNDNYKKLKFRSDGIDIKANRQAR